MSVRSELAKLRQQADQVRTDSDVKAISDLMDELSTAAAGGGCTRGEVSLLEILGEAPAQQRPSQGLQNQKVTQ